MLGQGRGRSRQPHLPVPHRPRTDPPKTRPGWLDQRICARRLISRRTAGHDAHLIFERHIIFERHTLTTANRGSSQRYHGARVTPLLVFVVIEFILINQLWNRTLKVEKVQIWVPPTVAFGIVVIFLLVVARRSPSETARFPNASWLVSPIHVDSGWDIADSWLTNTSFFGNAASGIVVAAGGLTNVVSSDQAIIAITIVLFSTAALGAPIVSGVSY
jgi:hypothetical protein